jgi:Domain of unknown function (DUF4382)
MRLTPLEKTRPACRKCWNLRFRVALLFVVGLTGCNTCFTFTSNPSMGTIGIKAGDPSSTCTLAKATGAVRFELETEPVCSRCNGPGQVRRIFVSILSLQVNPSATADDDSPDWQELLPPELVTKPLQVDLVKGEADRGVRKSLGEIAPFPAGVYRQVRLRFVPNQPATDDRLPERNPCGSGTFNCIVMEDGSKQPLQLDGGSPELRITSDRIEGASLLILPDTDTALTIELKLVWTWSSSANGSLRLLPALTGSAKVGRTEFDELGTPEDGVVNDSHSR